MRLLVLAAATLSFSSSLVAQGSPALDSIRDDRHFSFYDRGPYRQNVPRPEAVLGYAIGEMNTQYSAQERVLLAIADAASDRIRVEEFGSSYERRTMRLFIVSSPENIARLDAIRADLDRLADPRGASASELEQIVARTPAVVFLSHSVHGNESPGFESAIQLLYQLGASEEPATVAALRNTLVVINPSSNPDGHERFTVWYNSINVGHPDPSSIEHDEPWSVQGRFNHYRFDMNRDVMASTQREVQGLMRAMLRWHPMVAADLHGMTERYFFPPVAKAINANFGDLFAKWMEILGRANAAAFDRYGWMYYSRDIFDFYAVFYWDTWPSLMGAAGMTYETDGGGWKGMLWRRDDGTLLSLRDGISKHWVASMATIEQTAARREERVRDFLRFRQSAIADGRTGPMKRFVLLPGNDPGRAAELVSALLRAGIEVRAADAEFSSSRAHAFRDDAVRSQRFPRGAYIVDLAQPNGRVARAFLEPTPSMDSAFVRAQIAKFVRNVRRGSGGVREGYEFYDLTAWSLPVAFGVEAYWTEDASAVSGRTLSLPAEEPTLPEAQRQARRVGGELLAVEIPGGIVTGANARSAYVFAPDRNGASRLAYHLMREGFRLAVATQPIEADGKEWPRGSWVVRVGRNDTTLASRLDALARESGVEVTGVNSAFTTAAQYGIGSEATVAVTAPTIAVVGDEGVSQTSYGAIWWTFERRYGIAFMPISIGYLAGGDLAKLNVIIIPSASPGALTARLGKDAVDRLKEWIRSGGTLITMGGSTAWAAREATDLTSGRAVGADDDSARAEPSPRDSATRRQASERTAEDLIPVRSPSSSNDDPATLPGTHFDVVLDRTHWLTFGYEDPRLTVMLDGDFFLKLSKDGANVAVFPTTGRLHRAGFIFPDNTERLLRGTALLVEESLGDGHVVAFVNEPMFRGWWRALDRLVLNAVLLGPSM
ncbi:MAG: M14 family zinc carboxypeptidase [Gemmatimonadaceae bacterium]